MPFGCNTEAMDRNVSNGLMGFPFSGKKGELMNNVGNATSTKESRWFSAVLAGILMCKVVSVHSFQFSARSFI